MHALFSPLRDLRLRLPYGVADKASPTVIYRARRRHVGLCSQEDFVDAPSLKHSFDLTVERAELPDPGRWAELRDFATSDASRPLFRSGRLLVARMEIEELPVRFRRELDVSWSDWLETLDSDLQHVGLVADTLEDRGGLQDGSFFFGRAITVHPAFRSQNLALGLIGHGLWLLGRSRHDAFGIVARPIRGVFANQEPDITPSSVRKLAAYYERIGFRPIGPVRDDHMVPMGALVRDMRFDTLGQRRPRLRRSPA